jgi:RNA polymerase sigma-70 factor (ECF subfamily)
MKRREATPEELRQEEEWIRACQAGDLSGLEGLYGRYHRQVYAYLVAMLRSPHAAEDVAQDIFVKLYGNIGSYRFQSPFHHWLFRLARNQAIDHLRREKVRRVASLDAETEDGPALKERLSAQGRDAAGDALSAERAEAVRRAVQALPPGFKEVVVLREWEDLSYEEIAERLNLSVGTVKSRLFRARSQLEKRLKDVLEGEPLP